MNIKKILLLTGALCLFKNSFGQELKVYSNFENGSAKLLEINQTLQTLRITPTGKPERGMPNWWYFRVEGIDKSKPLFIEIVPSEAIITANNGQKRKMDYAWTWPAQMAYSTDNKTWMLSSPGIKKITHILYCIENPLSTTIWMAWGTPFSASDAINLVDSIAENHSYASSLTLAHSFEGRRVPLLKISEGKKPKSERPAVWVQARQHAWEVGGSWVATGLANWLVSSDPEAIWLRQNAEIYIVPVMDVDHVATGDGGKHALPHDHNRDWNDNPYWPEIISAQKYIQMLSKENRLNIFLDLHNPSAGNKTQTLYVLDKTYMKQESFSRQERFIQLMIEHFGEIKQIKNDARPLIPNAEEKVSEVWVLDHANPNTVAFCVETPWNSPNGTILGYRSVGEKIGQVIKEVLLF